MPHSRSCTPLLCVCGHGHVAWPSEREIGGEERKGGEHERMQAEGEMMQNKMQSGRNVGADAGKRKRREETRGGERGHGKFKDFFFL